MYSVIVTFLLIISLSINLVFACSDNKKLREWLFREKILEIQIGEWIIDHGIYGKESKCCQFEIHKGIFGYYLRTSGYKPKDHTLYHHMITKVHGLNNRNAKGKKLTRTELKCS